MRAVRSSIAVLLAAALLTGCATSAAPPDAATAGGGSISLTVDDLTAAGVAIVDDETDAPAEADSYTVTATQADRIVAEAAMGAGLTGAQIDAAVPVDAGSPPMSYVLAGYVSTTDLPGDLRGKPLLDGLYPSDTDWTHPRQLVFPTAVLVLFVQDMMTAAAADDSFVPDGSAGGAGSGAGGTGIMRDGSIAVAAAVDAPCTTVQTFIQGTIQKLFDVLRVIPGAVTQIAELGPFGTLLAAVLNHAIGLAQGVVEGLVATITAPVLNVIRIALGGLGTAALVLSYFTNERLVVTPTPTDHTAFSIDPAPGMTGEFTAHARSLTDDWPQAVVDCAKASGAEIPPLLRSGDEARWSLTAGDQLVALSAATSAVTSEKTAVMRFTTGHEDAETAKGPEVTEIARVTVTVPRKEVGDFFDLAARQVETAKKDILARVPELFRSAAATVLDAAIDPIVASMRTKLEDAAGGIGMLQLTGEGFVWVTHHEPKEPTPTPDPTAAPDPDDGAFCRQFDEEVSIAVDSLDAADDLFAWAAAFARGLHSITATPPPALAADFATVVGFYDVSGTSSISDTGPIADYVASHDVDGARQRLWAACGAREVDLS